MGEDAGGGDERYPPIRDYAFLGDCHNWALVSRRGSIDWCCFERAGGHTACARLLDWDRGGYFRIAPTSDADVTRRYVGHTNVLQTTFETSAGVLEVTDALVLSRSGDGQGTVDPHDQLVRRVRCTAGSVEVRVEFVPRFDYGLTVPHVRVRGSDTATVVGGSDGLLLRSDIDLEQRSWDSCVGTVTLERGDQRTLSLSYAAGYELADLEGDAASELSRLDETVSFWQEWASRCTYEGPYREHVVRSALTLKALTDARTGAIMAAPTTSLPEEIGGERNWDYRYAWIRDAAWHINAMFGLGYDEEAHAFMRWLARTTAGSARDLQVMYGNTGARLIREIDLADLEGYRGSRPVRIGNGASEQFQLDLYGEVVNAAWHYHRNDGELPTEMRHLLGQVLDVVRERWQEPDKGIWEVRGAAQQFTSSKLYCWVAADRLHRLAQDGVVDVDLATTRALRDDIRDSIDRYGVDRGTGAFLRAYGRPGMDASGLLTVLEGFVAPDDPRVGATLDRIRDELGDADGVMIHRYRSDDGLSGQQSAFFWCSFWQVSVHVVRGEVDRGRELFEALLERTSDLGLLSEECHADSKELLGNYPQAISHVGLVDAALRLYEAEAGQEATERAMPV